MSRPLPLITPFNEFFWTGGADDELRFQRCQSCGTLRQPPAPICAVCRSTETEIATVSGRGTVVGFTVNHHQWLLDPAPPYVIAIVAIDEDDRVRLTTNIVGCDPDDVFVGMRVAVKFEQHEDVWLPMFEPTDDQEPGPLPEEEDVRPLIRPMLGTHKFEDDVAITGIGMSRVGRRLMVDPLALTVDACRRAVEDAGLTLGDIDGLSTYPGPEGLASGHSEGGVTALEEALRFHPTWINGGIELPGQSGAIVAAMLAISAGLCRHVLCFRTVWESTHATLAAMAPPPPMARLVGDFTTWRFPFGAMSAANWIGMCASNHFHRYGTTREALGWIALTARAHAGLNPVAIYRDPMSMDDYLSARMITTPFGLYDCDVPCDGCVAVVV
ncbi:MAG: 3-ketoacyl-CoA thiolase, partial [Actinobacteria bacterium]